VTLAKRDLHAGVRLDGIGGFTCYGTIDNVDVSRAERLLPMALSGDCVLTRDVMRDEPIGMDDVEVPPGRLGDALYAEQTAMFAAAPSG
jgi:predicted homoserine dehydrogenase-like protein